MSIMDRSSKTTISTSNQAYTLAMQYDMQDKANVLRKGIEKKILAIPKRQKELESLIEQ